MAGMDGAHSTAVAAGTGAGALAWAPAEVPLDRPSVARMYDGIVLLCMLEARERR